MKSLIILSFVASAASITFEELERQREEWMEAEESMAFGADLDLMDNEKRANEYLMNAKRKELEHGFRNPGSYPPAIHFFQGKPLIDKSEVFNFIRKMPKGAALHLHDMALASSEYVIENITSRENLYMQLRETNGVILPFFVWGQTGTPAPNKFGPYASLGSYRKTLDRKYGQRMADKSLARFLSLQVDVQEKPIEEVYPHINAVWQKFENTFTSLGPLLTLDTVFSDYIYQGLLEFHQDNVQYMEVRTIAPKLINMQNRSMPASDSIASMLKTLERFRKDHKDPIDMRVIYAPLRNADDQQMDENIQTYEELRELFPDFVIGFDLVAQEDLGRPLIDYAPKLVNMDGKFFFHAGETNWNGMSTDLNLFDAILLNTTRIGHGYALTKHPLLLDVARRRNIPLEVNPISNQVLMLVRDLRNHPAVQLFAENYPIVISADDPGLFGSKGLSYDMYMAFMAFTTAEGDLRVLKKLALNSIEYCGLPDKQKKQLRNRWQKKWNEFVDRY